MNVGPYCLFTFYILFCYSFCVTFISTLNIYHADGVLVFFLHLLCFVSHTRAAYIDPGFNDSEDENTDEFKDPNIPRCSKCDKYKPPRTHHCRICKRCVFKMDHHCPWINNCVGLYNQKFFFLFIFYLTLLSGYLSSYIIYKFIYEASSESDRSFLSHLINHRIDVFFLLIVTSSSLIFGLIMFVKQICSIHNNITTIEYKKEDVNPNGQCKSIWNNYVEVFGSKPCYHWLSPFDKPNTDIEKTLYSMLIRNNIATS